MQRYRMVGAILAATLVVGCSTTNPFSREKLALPTGPTYVGGRGIQVFPTSPKLLANVKEAMSDLNIHSIIQNEDPSGVIVLDAKTQNDSKVRVSVQTSGANSTVSARIGWMGDELLTRGLLDRIGSKQGILPAQPTATPTATDEKTAEKTKPQGIFSRDAVPDSVMLRDQVENGNMPAIAR